MQKFSNLVFTSTPWSFYRLIPFPLGGIIPPCILSHIYSVDDVICNFPLRFTPHRLFWLRYIVVFRSPKTQVGTPASTSFWTHLQSRLSTNAILFPSLFLSKPKTESRNWCTMWKLLRQRTVKPKPGDYLLSAVSDFLCNVFDAILQAAVRRDPLNRRVLREQTQS
jgi:hypothetical protein